MLTINTATGCVSFSVATSTTVTNLTSVSLEITHNCSTTITKTAASGPFTVLPVDFSFTDKMCDGVYAITYTSTYSNNTKIKETACHVLDCSLHCDVAAKYADTKDVELLRLYQIFKMAQACSDCNCQILCDLYSEITTDKVESNCGC